MAARISGVGVVTVSERRSTRPSGLGTSGRGWGRHGAEEAFLHDGDDDVAVLSEHVPEREAACTDADGLSWW